MTFLSSWTPSVICRSTWRRPPLILLQLLMVVVVGVLLWDSFTRQLACARWHIPSMTPAWLLQRRLQGTIQHPLACSAPLDRWATACHPANATAPRNSIPAASTASPLEIYVLYHSKEAHTDLFSPTSNLYTGLAIVPQARRPNTSDVDATAHLPILRDRFYQKQLCEYGGFFALLAGGFVSEERKGYVGLQSWKARRKGLALSCAGEGALGSAVEKVVRSQEDTFFFWSCPSKAARFTRFYWGCEHFHGRCHDVFDSGFGNLFGANPPEGLENGLPPMPDGGGEWSYMSYFALPAKQLQRYVTFAALFFSSLDDVYYDQLSRGICPHVSHRLSPEVGAERCLSFMMERLVNVWAYHSMLEMSFVDPTTGALKRVHATESRRSTESLQRWFSTENIDRLLHSTLNATANRKRRHVLDRLLPSKGLQVLQAKGKVSRMAPFFGGEIRRQGRR